MQSSWLRDALSELDPSCDKLTFTGNPPPQSTRARGALSKPMLRIQAAGTFGSTEVLIFKFALSRHDPLFRWITQTIGTSLRHSNAVKLSASGAFSPRRLIGSLHELYLNKLPIWSHSSDFARPAEFHKNFASH
jgi:hypothetical protein